MKNKITCKWLQDNWPIILCSVPETDHRNEIQDHLAGCNNCRNEFGSYFPAELWESQKSPKNPTSNEFTNRVLQGLGIGQHPEEPAVLQRKILSAEWMRREHFPSFPKIKFPPIVVNYLASAVVTLILIYSGYFNLLPRVESGATMLNTQVGKIFSQTQTRGKAELMTIWLKMEDLSNTLRINRKKD